MKCVGDKEFYRMVSKIAMPIIIQNGFYYMVNFVDNIMVGQIGTEAMSGVAIVNQLLYVFNICILGIIAGASIFGAQFYGDNNINGLRETFCFRLLACTGLTIAAIIIFAFWGVYFISLFLHSGSGSSQVISTLDFGKTYLTVMLVGLFPSAITQVYASTHKDMGKTFLPMISSIIAVALNTGLNYILIFGNMGMPVMGVKGAAIATVISRFVECFIIVIATHIRNKEYPFIKGILRNFKISAGSAKQILVKGSPLMINEFFWSIGSVIMIQCYSVRGIQVVAGMNIATAIYNVFSIFYIAVGSSIAIIIGQLLGAGKMEEAKDTDDKLIFLAVISSLIMAVIVFVTAPYYPRIYNTTEEVRLLASRFISILAVFMPVSAYIHAAFFTIRAGGNTMITFLFDSSNLWLVSIPLAFCLTRYTGMGIVGIYLICQMADAIKCIVGYILVKKGVWLKNIVQAQLQ